MIPRIQRISYFATDHWSCAAFQIGERDSNLWRQMDDLSGFCGLCGRSETLTRHHLIPRTRHHNKRNKRQFDRAAVKETVGICRPCHSQLHAVLSEKELERGWNTLEKIIAHPEIHTFSRWISTKPRGFRSQTREVKRCNP